MKTLVWLYPSLVGMLLGSLQTGLFFQLTFTLSASFRTFLMITVCWLLGSVIGIRMAVHVKLQLNGFVLLGMTAYFICVALLKAAPFDTRLWPAYSFLIILTGLYPGVFFVRLSEFYTARQLFFRENNGFIVGLISGTLLFLVVGRASLWGMPIVVAGIIMICTISFFDSGIKTMENKI